MILHGMLLHNMVLNGMVLHGTVLHGMLMQDNTWYGIEDRTSIAWYFMARHCMACYCMLPHGMVLKIERVLHGARAAQQQEGQRVSQCAGSLTGLIDPLAATTALCHALHCIGSNFTEMHCTAFRHIASNSNEM